MTPVPGEAGLEENARGGVYAGDLVGDGGAVHRHLEEVAASALHALLDRYRHLVRLAVTHPDLRLLVADHDQRGEREAPAALDHLRHAVDLDHALLKVAVAAAAALIPVALSGHCRPVEGS